MFKFIKKAKKNLNMVLFKNLSLTVIQVIFSYKPVANFKWHQLQSAYSICFKILCLFLTSVEFEICSNINEKLQGIH